MSDDTQRDDDALSVWERIGRLTGRQDAVEREQGNIHQRLDKQYEAICGLRDEIHSLSKRIAWLMGGILVVCTLAGSAGWYMAQAGIAPLDGAVVESSE